MYKFVHILNLVQIYTPTPESVHILVDYDWFDPTFGEKNKQTKKKKKKNNHFDS